MKKSFGLLSIVVFLLASCLKESPTGPSFEEQLKVDVAAIDEYLANNGINAEKDPSGVRYLITQQGEGVKPVSGSTVFASFKGTVISTGKVFTDSKDAFGKTTLADPLLASWQVVLPKVNKGGTVTIYSPSGLAYGNTSSADGSLPANANVIFNIKLYDSLTQFKIDTAAIQAYLKKNNIVTSADPSGLKYIITTFGNGDKPIASNTITINYTGKLLSTEAIFDQSTSPTSFPLSNLIKGFQIGMPFLPVGSKATFYMPSALGYGPAGSGTIPSNANLIFDVELVSIK
jgi:FKBP-type peptidyl-prolyl cis-trans isomerase FkpA